MSRDKRNTNFRTTPHKVLIEFEGRMIEVFPNISPDVVYPGEVIVRQLLRNALERHDPKRYALMRRREGIELRQQRRLEREAQRAARVAARPPKNPPKPRLVKPTYKPA